MRRPAGPGTRAQPLSPAPELSVPRRWLIEAGCLVDTEVFLAAFNFHSVSFIENLAEQHIDVLEVSPRACLAAIRLNRLDLLRWLRRRGWPWDYDCFVAAVFADPAVLRFVLENGCPARDVCWHIIHVQALRNLEVALELGFECDALAVDEALDMYKTYAHHPSGPWLAATDVLVLVLQLDCPVPDLYLEPDQDLASEMQRWSPAVLELLEFKRKVRRVRRSRAARVIQAKWLRCYYTPTEPICRARLIREFDEEPRLKRVRVC